MFINNCLTTREELVTINVNDSIGQAIHILQKNSLKSVPVVNDENIFIGILSKEGLFELMEKGTVQTYEELQNESVEKATTMIQPLQLTNRFEETLPIIVRYPFVPIIDDEKHLLGIVKRKKITLALESSFGVGISGIRLLIGTAEMEGRLEKILEIAHEMNLNVITAVAFDAGERFNRRVLLKIEYTKKKEKFLKKLEKKGFKILTVHED